MHCNKINIAIQIKNGVNTGLDNIYVEATAVRVSVDLVELQVYSAIGAILARGLLWAIRKAGVFIDCERKYLSCKHISEFIKYVRSTFWE